MFLSTPSVAARRCPAPALARPGAVWMSYAGAGAPFGAWHGVVAMRGSVDLLNATKPRSSGSTGTISLIDAQGVRPRGTPV